MACCSRPNWVTGRSDSTGICPSICPRGGSDESAEWYSAAVMTCETNGARDVDVSVLELDQNRRRFGSDASWNRSSHTRVSTIYSRHASGRSRASHIFHACIVAKKKCGRYSVRFPFREYDA